MEELDWVADRPDNIFVVFSFLGEEYSRRREKGSVLLAFGIHHDAIDSMVKGIKSIYPTFWFSVLLLVEQLLA